MLDKNKILFLDIETFPNVAYVWGKYDQNVIRFKQEGCVATYVAKWLGKSKIISQALPDFKGYAPGSYDDKLLIENLWKLLDEAEVVVAHNGDQFDVRTCNGRFLFHGLRPPSPFKTIDTKKVVKRVARFNSNKLDDLGQLLGIGQKIKTDFDLWKGCIDGDKKAWARMVKYNKQDVLLLERLYLQLRPWMLNHPNLSTGAACPKCGSEKIQYNGYRVSNTRRYRRFQCHDCGGWGRDTKSLDGTTVANA